MGFAAGVVIAGWVGSTSWGRWGVQGLSGFGRSSGAAAMADNFCTGRAKLWSVDGQRHMPWLNKNPLMRLTCRTLSAVSALRSRRRWRRSSSLGVGTLTMHRPEVRRACTRAALEPAFHRRSCRSLPSGAATTLKPRPRRRRGFRCLRSRAPGESKTRRVTRPETPKRSHLLVRSDGESPLAFSRGRAQHSC